MKGNAMQKNYSKFRTINELKNSIYFTIVNWVSNRWDSLVEEARENKTSVSWLIATQFNIEVKDADQIASDIANYKNL